MMDVDINCDSLILKRKANDLETENINEIKIQRLQSVRESTKFIETCSNNENKSQLMMDIEIKTNESGRKRKRDELESEDSIQVGLILDGNLLQESSKLPNVANRAFVVHKLIESYDLLRNLKLYEVEPAEESELCNFHSSDYIQYLKSINNSYTPDDDVELEYGLGYDCPPLDGLFDYCRWIAGGTLSAVRALLRAEVDVAINWTGGWHHAHRYGAEGFCYVNDIALAILELRTKFNYILYIDLDIHHGNGVESCFEMTDKVFTVSLHQYESGFYPGTGVITDVGSSKGRYFTLNVPLREGITDGNYCRVFDRIFDNVRRVFSADAVVLQCGADGLSGDPLGSFNLTEAAYGHCVNKVLSLRKPTLVLGGGGYNIANTARCWTFLTSLILGTYLDPDIPEHENFSLFGPSYELSVTTSNRKDLNTKNYIDTLLKNVEENLKNI
ncbi:hypothetical protein O3M35_000163 [Rhynocoris fuscipes]|uniref:Histone deacetylase 8 n=1 Tax=Rhynocoris fuscipes TaxID=488301 RepID=A0AAW1DS23_9HEMI